MYNHNVSKSIKRRRFLEEVETLNFLIDSQPKFDPQPYCISQEIPVMTISNTSNNNDLLIAESNILNKSLDVTEKK
jgi:hypothetical protein